MTGAAAVRRLVAVLRAENAALAAGDAAGAAALLEEKLAAAAALESAKDTVPSVAEARALRDAVAENGERLALAIEVQGRIMELVGRAAREALPAPSYYGRGGRAVTERGAMAMVVRA